MVPYERRDRSSSRDSRRGPSRGGRGRDSGRDRREVVMTKVICSACKKECEVPFKPTSDKPVFCNDCFAKEGGSDRRSGGRSERRPNKELEMINEKLDKIIIALKIK